MGFLSRLFSKGTEEVKLETAEVPTPVSVPTPSRWQEKLGGEIAEAGNCFLAVVTTENSMSPMLWQVQADGIRYSDLIEKKNFYEKYKADFLSMMAEPGIHIYRYEDGRITDEKWIEKYNVELFNLDACELIIFQEYGLSPEDEERKNKLQESLKAEKVKETLVYACYENDTEKILSCLERASKAQLNKKLGGLGTPLGFCVQNKNFKAFQAIAEKGADLGKTSIAYTPLKEAFLNSAEDIVFYIYENYREQFDKEVGKEGFSIACTTSSKRLLELLLQCGCEINGAGHKFPPLHNFADYNNTTGIRFLLEHGADINIKNNYGQTALDRANNAGAEDARKLLEEYAKR